MCIPLKNDKMMAGLLFMVTAAQFLIFMMLGEGMAPDYSMNENAISDLGIIPETALLFAASLVLVGVLTILGGYYLYRVHQDRTLFLFYIIAGVGAIGAGVFDLNNPTGLHGLFALLAFIFFNVMAISTGKLLNRSFKVISVALAIIGLTFVVVMFVSDAGIIDLFGPWGHGGTERMIVYPPMIWLLAFSGYLLSEGHLKIRSG